MKIAIDLTAWKFIDCTMKSSLTQRGQTGIGGVITQANCPDASAIDSARYRTGGLFSFQSLPTLRRGWTDIDEIGRFAVQFALLAGGLSQAGNENMEVLT